MPTIADQIHETADAFEAAGLYFGHGTFDPLDEAAWLMSHVLGIDPAELETRAGDTLTGAQLEQYETLAHQRIDTRKPLAYLIHEAWFCGLKLYVDERAIVPRSLIGETILDDFQPWRGEREFNRILDLCSGSGCIAIALAQQYPGATIDAVDLSRDALEVAAINVERYELNERIELIESDVFDALEGRRYDLIVSNPPYVHPQSMPGLPAEYHAEPEMALSADEGGLAIIDRIMNEAHQYLNQDGLLVVEVGESRDAVDEKYAHLPLTWLAHESGEEVVFLIEARDLPGG